ncbi:tryptophan aminotransferase-related protein 3-like [Carica papaya]|uniref:tryptophan aminotransferase-related protein 3-like n=1 Tax=Carica papaya TaxID=3649 RepID=UPI000B8C933A|nr:tryptophan aminotransferase-related protein 3-like [Carica papaya]
MERERRICRQDVFVAVLVACLGVNIWLVSKVFMDCNMMRMSWSGRSAMEAEAVGAITCSGHGRAYIDGDDSDGKSEPVCECNLCFQGTDCSVLIPNCKANADGGDPLFLEPFWVKHAASSAMVVAGWHRMSYTYNDESFMSKELEKLIRKLHAYVGNAITENRYILFGAGSSQLLAAAVHALSPTNSSAPPAAVLASVPYYELYRTQAELFKSTVFKFEGDARLWTNDSYADRQVIEFVTSPNNPDGLPNKAIVNGPNAKSIHDYAYYWPHFTPIPAPADEHLMIFTISKLTGHGGTRFGWAVIKEKSVYERMTTFIELNSMGLSTDTQLRVLKLLKIIVGARKERDIFDFGYNTMKSRWEKLKATFSTSSRFTLQTIPPQYCTFLRRVRESSPAYAWVRCKREEDKDCSAVLDAANIIGRRGSMFGAENRYVRLSLIRNQDDFDLLIHRLNKLVMEEDGNKTV